VEVLPIFELCEKILGDPISLEKEETAYYNMVIDEVLGKDPGERYRYDAVLVDEGQDFDTRMLQVALKCLNPASEVFTVALDEGQEIYGRKRDWRALGINLKGKVRSLGSSYRNTFEIAAFADRFRAETGMVSSRIQPESRGSTSPAVRVEQFQLFPDPPVVHGPEPELLHFPSMEDAIGWTAKKIRALRDDGSYSLAEIGVIYTRKRLDSDHPDPFPARMMTALEREGVVSRWIAEDYRARRACDITAESVAINTIHSAKGLDFGCVFLFGLDTIDIGKDRESEQRARNLVFSGITRARYQLFVPYMKEAGILAARVIPARSSQG
jgi:superfamily I DNA/RNA helicase